MEFITNHIELIGGLIGISIYALLVATASLVDHTKWNIVWLYALIIPVFIGALTLGQDIAKWIIK